MLGAAASSAFAEPSRRERGDRPMIHALLHEWLKIAVSIAVPAIELMALAVITTGTIEGFVRGTRVMWTWPENPHEIRAAWLRYSRWLVAGLSFQLAADIIATSVAPSWEEIGKLAAVAAIRTFLNYFLERDQGEMRRLRGERAEGGDGRRE